MLIVISSKKRRARERESPAAGARAALSFEVAADGLGPKGPLFVSRGLFGPK